jgi:RND family efflux transporter MFP subunit
MDVQTIMKTNYLEAMRGILRTILRAIPPGAASLLASAAAVAGNLATAPVIATAVPGMSSYGAVVEAVRQTTVAAQVSGAVLQIHVRAGETVRAGQTLILLDARAAEQTAAAGDAQVKAAQAALDVATRDFERQQRMREKNYISDAALERAQAQYRATQAQVSAQLAQAGAARTQSGFYQVKAPYAGVVAEVPVSVGDMAMPGKPLLTLYDPGALRVTAMIPQSALAGAALSADTRIEIQGLPVARSGLHASRVEILPTADPQTHTVEVRLSLAPPAAGVSPGMFARVWLPVAPDSVDSPAATAPGLLLVPFRAVIRRAEVTGLYVVDAAGHAVLRQVRLGETRGDSVEILSGVSAGEQVALDPQAAARAQ